ncbi:hypothetical protein M758_9G003300 [Ceratodon purpureus]|nr:hypothetical protein M758_9G003300 [Ceratodon purpureus]
MLPRSPSGDSTRRMNACGHSSQPPTSAPSLHFGLIRAPIHILLSSAASGSSHGFRSFSSVRAPEAVAVGGRLCDRGCPLSSTVIGSR